MSDDELSSNSSVASDESTDAEIICGRRQRRDVDYKKLYDVSNTKFLKFGNRFLKREKIVMHGSLRYIMGENLSPFAISTAYSVFLSART